MTVSTRCECRLRFGNLSRPIAPMASHGCTCEASSKMTTSNGNSGDSRDVLTASGLNIKHGLSRTKRFGTRAKSCRNGRCRCFWWTSAGWPDLIRQPRWTCHGFGVCGKSSAEGVSTSAHTASPRTPKHASTSKAARAKPPSQVHPDTSNVAEITQAGPPSPHHREELMSLGQLEVPYGSNLLPVKSIIWWW